MASVRALATTAPLLEAAPDWVAALLGRAVLALRPRPAR